MTYREIIKRRSIKYLTEKEIELLNRILTHKNRNINIMGSIENYDRNSNSFKQKEAERNVQNVWMY